MTKLVIFDKDGVLLDLEATWLPVARTVAAYTIASMPVRPTSEQTPPAVTAADLLRAVGIDDARGNIDPKGLFAAGSFTEIRKAWQDMLPADMIALDSDPVYCDAVHNIVLQEARHTTKPKGDVVTPLQALYQDGYVLAVVTNDDEDSARQNLQDLGIADLFSTVVGADSGHGAKPEPGGLLHCCKRAGVDPKDSIMVGDTMADYGAALAAGCQSFICVADAYEFRPHEDILPENVIANLTGLPRLLASR